MAKRRLPLIKYTARDFDSIRTELNEYRRRYYSDISKDENEAAFDEMMIDTVAYVGDMLSFYADYNVNESFLTTAVEYNNVLKHGRKLGYKFRGNPSSFGIATFYIIAPANATGLGPDERYLFTLKRGSQCISTGGVGFILNQDVTFADPSNEVVVARVDETTGVPTAYAVQARGQIISGRINEEIIDIGSFQKFLRVELTGRDISEILTVTDDEGKEYFEVDYLSQDVVFRPVINTGENQDTVPSLLKPFVVPRRFTVERQRISTFLQFGGGSEDDETSEPLIDPSTVVLDVFGKDHVIDATVDPTNLLGTDKLGISPANTRLRVVYRVNTSDNVNASADSVTSVVEPIFEFESIDSLDPTVVRSVLDSLEVTNENSINGDVSAPTVDELKLRIFGTFGAQNRAVTEKDYVSLCYQMPPQFGSIKRAVIVRDRDSFKRNLNLYVISEDEDGNLVRTNETVKQNLRTWLLRSKMLDDTIDILDARIINVGVDFEGVAEMEENAFNVLNNAQLRLRSHFANKFDIGEPFSILEIYKQLQRARGLVDVTRVNVFQKSGGNYSDTRFNLEDQISPDGRFVDAPKNVIFEVKFLDADIKGVIK